MTSSMRSPRSATDARQSSHPAMRRPFRTYRHPSIAFPPPSPSLPLSLSHPLSPPPVAFMSAPSLLYSPIE
eukprot:440482-Hanusia_phi.AAC.1